MSTKKPRLQKKPERKELKGKLPTKKAYRNCSPTQCQCRELTRNLTRRTSIALHHLHSTILTHLGCAGEESIHYESVNDLRDTSVRSLWERISTTQETVCHGHHRLLFAFGNAYSAPLSE